MPNPSRTKLTPDSAAAGTPAPEATVQTRTPSLTVQMPDPKWKDYQLIDSGNFEKLERFGPYYLIRPEPKALWDKSLSEKEWTGTAHVRFCPGAGFSKAGKEDSGTWKMLRRMEEQWQIGYRSEQGLSFALRLGLTSFKHVGVFPEQAPNWDFIYSATKTLSARQVGGKGGFSGTSGGGANEPKVLNLFAYTGAASLAARAAGADVTHLDSVRQVVTWAKGNMERSGLDGIRWIIEDALAFARREVKRGHHYKGIILDPPAYGHGPDGQKWKLDECLFELLRCVGALLDPEEGFMVLNLYSNGYSALLGETLVNQAVAQKGQDGVISDSVSSGELALPDSFGKALPLSIVVRLQRRI